MLRKEHLNIDWRHGGDRGLNTARRRQDVQSVANCADNTINNGTC